MNYTLQMCLHIVTLQNILSYYHYNVLNLKITYFVITSHNLQAVLSFLYFEKRCSMHYQFVLVQINLIGHHPKAANEVV